MACGQGIAVFEATRRHALAVLSLCLAPLAAVVFTPFVRPFRWSRLLWTYVPPVLPCVALVDGVVSCLRTYTPSELRTLTEGLDAYVWEAGETFPAYSPVPVTYLIGYPGNPGGAR